MARSPPFFPPGVAFLPSVASVSTPLWARVREVALGARSSRAGALVEIAYKDGHVGCWSLSLSQSCRSWCLTELACFAVSHGGAGLRPRAVHALAHPSGANVAELLAARVVQQRTRRRRALFREESDREHGGGLHDVDSSESARSAGPGGSAGASGTAPRPAGALAGDKGLPARGGGAADRFAAHRPLVALLLQPLSAEANSAPEASYRRSASDWSAAPPLPVAAGNIGGICDVLIWSPSAGRAVHCLRFESAVTGVHSNAALVVVATVSHAFGFSAHTLRAVFKIRIGPQPNGDGFAALALASADAGGAALSAACLLALPAPATEMLPQLQLRAAAAASGIVASNDGCDVSAGIELFSRGAGRGEEGEGGGDFNLKLKSFKLPAAAAPAGEQKARGPPGTPSVAGESTLFGVSDPEGPSRASAPTTALDGAQRLSAATYGIARETARLFASVREAAVDLLASQSLTSGSGGAGSHAAHGTRSGATSSTTAPSAAGSRAPPRPATDTTSSDSAVGDSDACVIVDVWQVIADFALWQASAYDAAEVAAANDGGSACDSDDSASPGAPAGVPPARLAPRARAPPPSLPPFVPTAAAVVRLGRGTACAALALRSALRSVDTHEAATESDAASASGTGGPSESQSQAAAPADEHFVLAAADAAGRSIHAFSLTVLQCRRRGDAADELALPVDADSDSEEEVALADASSAAGLPPLCEAALRRYASGRSPATLLAVPLAQLERGVTAARVARLSLANALPRPGSSHGQRQRSSGSAHPPPRGERGGDLDTGGGSAGSGGGPSRLAASAAQSSESFSAESGAEGASGCAWVAAVTFNGTAHAWPLPFPTGTTRASCIDRREAPDTPIVQLTRQGGESRPPFPRTPSRTMHSAAVSAANAAFAVAPDNAVCTASTPPPRGSSTTSDSAAAAAAAAGVPCAHAFARVHLKSGLPFGLPPFPASDASVESEAVYAGSFAPDSPAEALGEPEDGAGAGGIGSGSRSGLGGRNTPALQLPLAGGSTGSVIGGGVATSLRGWARDLFSGPGSAWGSNGGGIWGLAVAAARSARSQRLLSRGVLVSDAGGAAGATGVAVGTSATRALAARSFTAGAPRSMSGRRGVGGGPGFGDAVALAGAARDYPRATGGLPAIDAATAPLAAAAAAEARQQAEQERRLVQLAPVAWDGLFFEDHLISLRGDGFLCLAVMEGVPVPLPVPVAAGRGDSESVAKCAVASGTPSGGGGVQLPLAALSVSGASTLAGRTASASTSLQDGWQELAASELEESARRGSKDDSEVMMDSDSESESEAERLGSPPLPAMLPPPLPLTLPVALPPPPAWSRALQASAASAFSVASAALGGSAAYLAAQADALKLPQRLRSARRITGGVISAAFSVASPVAARITGSFATPPLTALAVPLGVWDLRRQEHWPSVMAARHLWPASLLQSHGHARARSPSLPVSAHASGSPSLPESAHALESLRSSPIVAVTPPSGPLYCHFPPSASIPRLSVCEPAASADLRAGMPLPPPRTVAGTPSFALRALSAAPAVSAPSEAARSPGSLSQSRQSPSEQRPALAAAASAAAVADSERPSVRAAPLSRSTSANSYVGVSATDSAADDPFAVMIGTAAPGPTRTPAPFSSYYGRRTLPVAVPLAGLPSESAPHIAPSDAGGDAASCSGSDSERAWNDLLGSRSMPRAAGAEDALAEPAAAAAALSFESGAILDFFSLAAAAPASSIVAVPRGSEASRSASTAAAALLATPCEFPLPLSASDGAESLASNSSSGSGSEMMHSASSHSESHARASARTAAAAPIALSESSESLVRRGATAASLAGSSAPESGGAPELSGLHGFVRSRRSEP